MPISLKKLGEQFNVDTLKTEFPYDFLNDKYNPNIDLNYIGVEPNIKIKSIVPFDLNFHVNFIYNPQWSVKGETLKYCLTDCICLHQVLIKFNQFIFNKFKVNINKLLIIQKS